MSGVPDQLLRALGSGVRGQGVAAARPAAADPSADFAAILSQAREGRITTDAPVTVARGAGVELSPDQLQRLSAAADTLEAAGATRALVLMDGRPLVLDVASRTVAAAPTLAPGQPVVGVDAVLRLPDAHGRQAASTMLPPPGADLAGLNPSLARALAGERD